MKAAEVDACIDKLDRAERPQPEAWRFPLTNLMENLSKARRVRRWIATPLLAAAVAVPQIWHEGDWSIWLVTSVTIGTFFMWLMQRTLERAYPILAREARVEALQAYFAPWRYGDDDEERAS